MFYKVKEIKICKDYILLVTFENRVNKYYDVKKLFDLWTTFKVLRDYKFFSNVKVDVGGIGISWNDELDLSCNELWNNGKEKVN